MSTPAQQQRYYYSARTAQQYGGRRGSGADTIDDALIAAAFPRWTEFLKFDVDAACALYLHLTGRMRGTVFQDESYSRTVQGMRERAREFPATIVRTLAAVENVLSSMRLTIQLMSLEQREQQILPAPKFAAQCVAFALRQAQYFSDGTSPEKAHCMAHPSLTCYAAPILAQDRFQSDLAFDFEGVILTCEKVRESAEEIGVGRGEIEQFLRAATACSRISPKSTFTCAPQGAISKGAIAALFVPPEFIPVFDSWLRRELVDQRREKDIVTYFKPGWCAGLTVANVISSGMCGGYIGDRRKKKRGAASKGDEKGKGRGRGGRKRGRGGRKNDGDAAPAAGRGRGRGRGGRGRGRGRGRDYGVPALHDMHLEDGGDPAREEDGASLRRIPEGLADLIDEFGAADESLLKVLNDKIIGGDGDEDGDGEFIALRRRRMLESNLMDGTSLMPRAARAGGGSDDEEDAHADGRRAGDEAADPHQLACWRFKPWFWNVPRHDDAGRKRAKWEGADMEFVTFVADGDGGSENSGGSDSGIPDRVSEHWTREFRMLAAAVPSVWVDARASAGSGSPWSCGLFPCGCTLVVLANVVYSVLKNLALNDAKRGPAELANSISAMPPHAAVALAVELASGSVTRHEVGRPGAADALARTKKQLVNVAEEVTEALKRAASASPTRTPCMWIDIVGQWGSAMSIARRRIAEAAAAAPSSSSPIVQAWYFAKVKRSEWAHEAADRAASERMFGRAEEIATVAAATRWTAERRQQWRETEIETAEPTPERRQRCERPKMSAAFTTAPESWPCDADWASTLAAERMRMHSQCMVGAVIPLIDSEAAIIFPGTPPRGIVIGAGPARKRRRRTATAPQNHGDADKSFEVIPNGCDAYVSGSLIHMLGAVPGTRGAMADCSALYPAAFLLMTCGPAARRTQFAAGHPGAQDDHFIGARDEEDEEEEEAVGRSDGAARRWDDLIGAAIAFASDSCFWANSTDGKSKSENEKRPEASLATDAGGLLSPKGDGDRRDVLFSYRCLGRAFSLACAALGDGQSRMRRERMWLLRRGIVCAARPRRTWTIGTTALAKILRCFGDSRNRAINSPGMAPLKRALADAADRLRFDPASNSKNVKEEAGEEGEISDPFVWADRSGRTSILPGGDRRDRAAVNAFLVALAALSDPDTAAYVLTSIDLARDPEILDGPPDNLGILAARHLRPATGSFSRHQPDTAEFRRRIDREMRRRGPDGSVDESIYIEDEEEEEEEDESGDGDARTPCLELLGSEYIKYASEFERTTEAAGDGTIPAADALLNFLMETEIDARIAMENVSADVGAAWKAALSASSMCSTAKGLSDACARAWKERGVPLAVRACVPEYITSAGSLPMADHPMSNPRSFPVACGGCGRRKFPEHRWDPARYPFSWCYPPKQGALMSEIIHAKAGLVVFPHAHPPSSSSSSASASASANLGYPVSVVRQIINSVEREEETANANPAPRADADLLIERKSREDAAAADARKKSMPPPIQKLSTSVSSRLGLANTQTERELDAAVRAFDRDMRETDETDHPAADPNIGAALRDLCDMRRQKGGGGGGEGQ